MLKTRPSPYFQLRHALDDVDVAFNKPVSALMKQIESCAPAMST
jgi:hypothetical protein